MRCSVINAIMNRFVPEVAVQSRMLPTVDAGLVRVAMNDLAICRTMFEGVMRGLMLQTSMKAEMLTPGHSVPMS